jgi:hypothetical protein
LIGAYRGGKTYPAIHEDLFICNDNPGHEFGVFRDTWDSLKTNIQKDFLKIASDANAIKNWNETDRDLTLWNDCVVRFRPLTLSREKLKGMNMCGYHIDDPNVNQFKKTIAFLPTRLTDPPNVKAKYYNTIITANYEGHDYLWQTYMRRREPGGDGRFAYWLCQTKDNSTLDPDYIPNLVANHSEQWVKRYLEGDTEGYVGLVYDEYDPKIHDADLSWCVNDHSLLKILVVDPGITHPTVIYNVATDMKNIYFYNEWYKTNVRTGDLGDQLILTLSKGENFLHNLIDPKASARDQTSGISPRDMLRTDFGIKTRIANNAIKPGIEIMKGLMTVRDNQTRFFIDPERCPNGIRELENLKWKEPEYSDFDELAYKEEPEDKDNHCCDCMRYASVFFKKKIRLPATRRNLIIKNRVENWNNRITNLKHYAKHPDQGTSIRSQIVRDFHYQKKKIRLQRMLELKKQIAS